jgi:hypothetical protein
MEYRFNEASVTLPAELIDKSLQTFILADGKQNFNVVISRVDLESGETLPQLCDRLLKEWQSKLPQFTLNKRLPITVDGEDAEYFDCRWNANGVPVNQRQVVILTPSPDKPEPLNGLVITGTCHTLFAPPYTEIFERFILSLQWRERAREAGLPNCCFALSRTDRRLRVFDSAESACSQVNPFEVENELWRFYDSDGSPLLVRWIEHNRLTSRGREPGKYQLIPGGSWSEFSPLQNQIDTIEDIEESPYIKTLAELRRYLQRLQRQEGER